MHHRPENLEQRAWSHDLEAVAHLLAPLVVRLDRRSSLSPLLCAAAVRADVEGSRDAIAATMRATELDEADMWVLGEVVRRTQLAGCEPIPISAAQIRASLERAGVHLTVEQTLVRLMVAGWLELAPPTSVRLRRPWGPSGTLDGSECQESPKLNSP